MTDTKALLGGRIRELRKGSRKSQEQLAEIVEVDPRYISRIEMGYCFPSLVVLEKIAHALNVTMKELFEYELEDDNLDIHEAISLLLKSVEDPEQRELILRITKSVTEAVIHKVSPR